MPTQLPWRVSPKHSIGFDVDGEEKQIPLDQILYVESLENYVKVNTAQKTHLVRLSMKEAEAKLPKPFLRISRSHIVNTSRIEAVDQTNVKINGQFFKIGKVYKRYVEEQLAPISIRRQDTFKVSDAL
jgi:DNA-binding LytR/AlgR family response regulator